VSQLNVKPRTPSERKLLDELNRLREHVEERILLNHEALEVTKQEARLAYQDELTHQGIEGVRMIRFLKSAGCWRKRDR